MGEWVTIIHPGTGGTGEVHQASLPQHYAAGWRLLADDEVLEPEPQTEPPPVSKAQAAKAAKAADQAATDTATSEEK